MGSGQALAGAPSPKAELEGGCVSGGKVPAPAIMSSWPPLFLLSAWPAPHPCPTAPLAGLPRGNGNQHQYCRVFLPMMFAGSAGEDVLVAAVKAPSHTRFCQPCRGPSTTTQGVETSCILCVGANDLTDQREKHFPAGGGSSFVIWQCLQSCDVFILNAFADLLSPNGSEAGVNY